MCLTKDFAEHSRILWLCVVMFLATALRVFMLYHSSLWIDEVQTLRYVEGGIDELMKLISGEQTLDIHPPLYYAVLWVWLQSSYSEFAARLLSFLFGTLSLPLCYLWVKRWYSCRTALICTTLMALSMVHIIYSVEIRMYSLVVLETILLNVWFSRWLDYRSKRALAGYAFTVILSLYTYHFMVFVILAQQIYAFMVLKKSKHLFLHWLGMWGIILIAYLPGLLRLKHQMSFVSHSYWGVTPRFSVLVTLFPWMICGPYQVGDVLLKTLVYISFGLMFLLGLWKGEKSWTRRWYFIAWLFVPPVVVFMLSQASPLFQPRYFLFQLPAVLLIVALGLEGTLSKGNWISAVVILLIAIVNLTALVRLYTVKTKIDVKSALELVAHSAYQNAPMYHLSGKLGNYETYLVARFYHRDASRKPEIEKIVGTFEQAPKEVKPVLDPTDFVAKIPSRESPLWIVYAKPLLPLGNEIQILRSYLPEGASIQGKYEFHQLIICLVSMDKINDRHHN